MAYTNGRMKVKRKTTYVTPKKTYVKKKPKTKVAVKKTYVRKKK